MRLLVCGVFLVALGAQSAPATTVLHIKVSLTDERQQPTPVPRHKLLISENPASATPRLVTTGVDGTADVTVRPGNYTVESDAPVTFHGRAYEWTVTLDIAANREATLDLTAANADVTAAGTAPAAAGDATGRPLEADPAFLLPRWQASVISVWTPLLRASGFVSDSRGLIVTSQRLVGKAPTVEAQLSATVKVPATVLVSDPARDVAVLWVDPGAIAASPPIATGCGGPPAPALERGTEVFALGAPDRGDKDTFSGRVTALNGDAALTDVSLPSGAAGGPVFTADGRLLGVTSLLDENEERSDADSRLSTAANVCAAIAAAEMKMKTAAAPDPTHLPVEPSRTYPADALRAEAAKRTGRLVPYEATSSDFEIEFITPVLTYAAQDRIDQERRRERGRGAAGSGRGAGPGSQPDADQMALRPLLDFGEWSGYVNDFPQTLLVRVTPRFVENFWTTVGRMAAQTQGVSLPPIKRFKPGLARMQAFCGDREVRPIHPFQIEQRVSQTDAVRQGLYVFDPDTLGPACGTIKLTLYSEKDPTKGDVLVVPAGVLEQVWKDFEPYRAPRP